jgi:hypothetical protein
MLFILSTERSGSTLLSLALGANPRHISPPEMHVLAYETFDEWLADYPSAMLSLQFLLRASGIEMTDDDVKARFSGRTSEEVYRWLLDGRLPRGAVFIDKTPKYGRDPAALERIERFRPRYVWLVRHPLAVAASQIALRRERTAARAPGRLGPLRAPLLALGERLTKRKVVSHEQRYWVEVNRNIEAFLEGIDVARWKRVSFEAFVRDPEPHLRDLCGWLGSTFDPAMLAPQENIPREMRPELGDPKVYRHQRIDGAAADAWRRDVPESYLEAETARAMERWGVPRG